MGSDGPGYKTPQGIRVVLHVDSTADAERVFKAFSEGGKADMQLEKTFFARKFGMLTDRFDIPLDDHLRVTAMTTAPYHHCSHHRRDPDLRRNQAEQLPRQPHREHRGTARTDFSAREQSCGSQPMVALRARSENQQRRQRPARGRRCARRFYRKLRGFACDHRFGANVADRDAALDDEAHEGRQPGRVWFRPLRRQTLRMSPGR